ncbi:MAG: methyltransferase domain-containing protein [Rhodocyclaceae bacterium]|nr:methyltransferase domain-containing protein [Rhodocyclaceae bacterium]
MKISPFQALACPLDQQPLLRHGQSLRCPSGHSFDIASQGYANLLPVQNKRSLDPGDSKLMVAARQRFLDAGHYAPIAEVVSRLALADLPAGEVASCLDAGCGEGYYLRELGTMAAQRQLVLALFGLDISKWAVLSAAKQDRADEHTWLVGSNANLPMLPGTLDRVLCMFGFPVYAEFARVLRLGGQLLLVDPGPDHLRELREVIYPALKPARNAEFSMPAGFALQGTEAMSYEVEVSGAGAIADLLAMTPHLYRAPLDGREKVAALTQISLTVDVRFMHLKRVP